MHEKELCVTLVIYKCVQGLCAHIRSFQGLVCITHTFLSLLSCESGLPPPLIATHKLTTIFVISCFRRELDENCALLSCYAASIGKFLQYNQQDAPVISNDLFL